MITHHFDDQGSWARDMFQSPNIDAQARIVKHLTIDELGFLEAANDNHAGLESENVLLFDEASRAACHQLIHMRTRAFTADVLDSCLDYVNHYLMTDDIDLAEPEHYKLQRINNSDRCMKSKTHPHDCKSYFNEAWNLSLLDPYLSYDNYHQHCSGLVVVLTSPGSRESDFSILKPENAYRSEMTRFTLESIF